jgi:hypothetical protein
VRHNNGSHTVEIHLEDGETLNDLETLIIMAIKSKLNGNRPDLETVTRVTEVFDPEKVVQILNERFKVWAKVQTSVKTQTVVEVLFDPTVAADNPKYQYQYAGAPVTAQVIPVSSDDDLDRTWH